MPKKNEGKEKEALVKTTQNPLTAMHILLFQNNTTFGNRTFYRPQNVVNIQPVINLNKSFMGFGTLAILNGSLL